jgi:hypothetical protein
MAIKLNASDLGIPPKLGLVRSVETQIMSIENEPTLKLDAEKKIIRIVRRNRKVLEEFLKKTLSRNIVVIHAIIARIVSTTTICFKIDLHKS